MRDKFESWLLHDDEAITFYNVDFDKVTDSYCDARVQSMYVAYCAGQDELRRLAEIERKYNEIMVKEPECYRFEVQCNNGNWDEVYDDEIRPNSRRVTALYKLKKD